MYAVVERVGCKRVGNRNVPVNGSTVGHIIQPAFPLNYTQKSSYSELI
jgi:hypothetical protein